MALKLVTARQSDAVTLTEAKAHLQVTHDSDDVLIGFFIKAATDHVDGPKGVIGRALIDQTWDYFADAFPVDRIEIPLPPLIEVLGVYYRDAAGSEQLVAADRYGVDTASEPGRLRLTANGTWPTARREANAVRVRFRAGYLDSGSSPPAAAVPFSIKAAILLHIGDLYGNRETQVVGDTAVQLPWAARELLRPYRVDLGLA